jgi:RimJ/RimL family protein N-acetyltransferase
MTDGVKQVAMLAAVQLRAVEESDARLLFHWANDPVVRAMAFNCSPIQWESHLQWLRQKLADPNCRMFIAMVKNKPVGQVRFDQVDEHSAEVDIHTAPDQRGKGYGPAIIAGGVRLVFASTDLQVLIAVVKQGNRGSISAFLKAGFVPSGTCHVSGISCERLILRR